MTAKTKLIHKGTHYSACVLACGDLVVTSNRKQRGIRLTGADAVEWIDAIATAIDSAEAESLCRAIYQA